MSTLEVKSITKRFGEVTALDGVSFTLEDGLHALLGPNGSGKTTFMRILTGEIKADAGSIFLDGEDITAMGKRYRQRIGYVPQAQGILPSFTLYEYLEYIAYLKEVSYGRDAHIKECAERVGLSAELNRKLGGFSGGMKQRAVIAQGILGSPDILILDEPTAGLDPGQRVNLKNMLSEYAKEHSVLLATHIVPDISEISTDLLFLKRGKTAFHGTPESAVQSIESRVWLSQSSDGGEVLRTYTENGKAVYRLLCHTKPYEYAATVAPDLEDCYFYIFEKTL